MRISPSIADVLGKMKLAPRSRPTFALDAGRRAIAARETRSRLTQIAIPVVSLGVAVVVVARLRARLADNQTERKRADHGR